MINIKQILTEDRDASADLGCLMAMIPDDISEILVKFGKKIIPDEDLYIKDEEFGRETEGHITIRYGFTKDLTELDIRKIIGKQKSFMVNINKLDRFETPEFDVVILKANNPILNLWNEMSSHYPNEQKFPKYQQHLTIAYVKKGKFQEVSDMDIDIPITSICYSPIQGGKSYFPLDESVETIDDKIMRLELQWDKLDSMGNRQMEQQQIASELEKLRQQKERKQGIDPNSDKSKNLWAGVYNAIK